MKKLLSLLLALSLLLSLVPGAVAESAAQNQNLFMRTDDDPSVPSVSQMVAIGDTLYLFTWDSLYRFAPGDAEPVLLMDKLTGYVDPEAADTGDSLHVSSLFVMDGCLYGLGAYTGLVTRLTDESGAAVQEKLCTLDLSAFATGEEAIDTVASAGQQLYLMAVSYARAGTTRQLYEVSLEEGAKPAPLKTEQACSIFAGPEGQLLCTVEPTYGETDTLPSALLRYDPATQQETLLASTGKTDWIAAAAWNEAEQAVYYVIDTTLYRLDPGAEAPVACAYVPERGGMGSLACLPDGRLAFAGYSGVYLRTPTDDPAATTLIISGEYGSNAHLAAVAQHPELSISSSSDYLNGIEALSAAMVSGTGSMDLLSLSQSYQPVQKLIEKGYALDLSAFTTVSGLTAAMDQRFLAPLMADGKLYGVPTALYASTLCVNRAVWTETLGLSLEELPTSYPQLLDFIANFSYDYGADNEDVALCDSWDLKRDLLTFILSAEMASQWQASGSSAALDFSSDRFRGLIKQLDEIDFSDISMRKTLGDNPTDDQMNEYYSKQFLLTQGECSAPRALAEDNDTIPLLLSLEEGGDPVLPADLTVMLVNPRTTKAEAAAVYLGSYLGHLDSTSAAITLFPDNNAAVLDPSYENTMTELESWLAQREKALESAAEENKAELRSDIQATREWLEEYKQTGGVLITPEQIAAYREKVVPYLYPMVQSPITASNSAIATLTDQFVQDAMDADAFIKELDGRVRLMMLENQ